MIATPKQTLGSPYRPCFNRVHKGLDPDIAQPLQRQNRSYSVCEGEHNQTKDLAGYVCYAFIELHLEFTVTAAMKSRKPEPVDFRIQRVSLLASNRAACAT
jgi:hypothetical protein